jgi:hypothetical protein
MNLYKQRTPFTVIFPEINYLIRVGHTSDLKNVFIYMIENFQ